MYYAIKIWDKDSHFVEVGSTSVIEELPGIFAALDSKYPEANGYQLHALYVPETCFSVDREEFREAAENANADAMQKIFDAEEEEFL